MDGFLNVWKPPGPTSHDVIDQIRRLLGLTRVGHAGTLDPMACGVLVVALGKATRALEYIRSEPKEYRARMVLGVSTDTQDASGAVMDEADASGVTREMFEQVLQRFTGELEQIPPMVSAVKHQGHRLYQLAREGKIVERQPRQVEVHAIQVIEFLPGARAQAEIQVTCSGGTYIRTLCADIGADLGCGAHMSSLERTRVGEFRAAGSVMLPELADAQRNGNLQDHLVSVSRAVDHLPAAALSLEDVRRLTHGLTIHLREGRVGEVVRALSPHGELVAFGVTDLEDGRIVLRPRKVLAELVEVGP